MRFGKKEKIGDSPDARKTSSSGRSLFLRSLLAGAFIFGSTDAVFSQAKPVETKKATYAEKIKAQYPTFNYNVFMDGLEEQFKRNGISSGARDLLGSARAAELLLENIQYYWLENYNHALSVGGAVTMMEDKPKEDARTRICRDLIERFGSKDLEHPEFL